MPPTIPSSDVWLSTQFEKLWAAIRGMQNQTTYVLDPTVANPAAGTPNCKVIIGDITRDNFGNSTGLSGWGLASKRTGSWVSI